MADELLPGHLSRRRAPDGAPVALAKLRLVADADGVMIALALAMAAVPAA